MLLTSGLDGMTRLWDISTARLLCQTNAGRGLEFARRGDRLAWGVPGRTVGVWRFAPPAAMRFHQGRFRERATVWQHDLTADASLAVWSPARWADQLGFELLDLRGNGGVVHVPVNCFRPRRCRTLQAKVGLPLPIA
jgi:hypothetical protein